MKPHSSCLHSKHTARSPTILTCPAASAAPSPPKSIDKHICKKKVQPIGSRGTQPKVIREGGVDIGKSPRERQRYTHERERERERGGFKEADMAAAMSSSLSIPHLAYSLRLRPRSGCHSTAATTQCAETGVFEAGTCDSLCCEIGPAVSGGKLSRRRASAAAAAAALWVGLFFIPGLESQGEKVALFSNLVWDLLGS